MTDEEKDFDRTDDAPRRRQRIISRDTERVYSASQDQGERFDSVETERYIKRVIQSRSKEELTAALRALKEQAMPKKKRGRPSKRDQEEQRILMETIARHMDEINATRAALTGDVSGQPLDIFADVPLLENDSDDVMQQNQEPMPENKEETTAQPADQGEDVPEFIRMQQKEGNLPEDKPEGAEVQHKEKEEAASNVQQASTTQEGSSSTLAMLWNQGIDFHVIQDVPQLSGFDMVTDMVQSQEPAVQRNDEVPDYLARTRSFLSRAGVPMNNRMPQPQRVAEPVQERTPMREITIVCEGVLDVGEKDKQGVLRSSDYNYLASPDDVFISLQQVRQFALKRGDVVQCTCRPPRAGETKYIFLEPITVNGLAPQRVRDRVNFEHLTPLFPDSQFKLSRAGTRAPLSCRIVDLFAPIGKGQRALIVAQPKTGKTVLRKQIANANAANYPET